MTKWTRNKNVATVRPSLYLVTFDADGIGQAKHTFDLE